MKTLLVLFAFFCLLQVACSKVDNSSVGWKVRLKQFEDKGWKYVETLGTPGESMIFSYSSLPSAKIIYGYWTVDGVRQKRAFEQNNKYFCLLSFTKHDGDAFLIVLEKDK